MAGAERARPWFRRGRPPLRQVGEHPDYRFSLANERTFLAWIRTSLALLAGGVAVVQLVPAFSIPGGRHVLGVALIVIAIVIAGTAYGRWEHNERSLRLGEPLPQSWLPRILGIGISLVSLVALVLVLVGIAEGRR